MVRALLAGTKTQTRRICKNKIVSNGYAFDKATGHISCYMDELPPSVDLMQAKHDGFTGWWYDGWEQFCPYGQPGDRLWVRETHMLESNYGLDNESNYPPPFKDGRPIRRESSPDWGEWWTQAHYAATDPKPELCKADDDDRMAGWRPSIHMPRWASRITLEITGVRVERLQEISDDDARAEGATSMDIPKPWGSEKGWSMDWSRIGKPSRFTANGATLAASDICLSSPRHAFWNLIDKINGDGTWDANPWVWVVEFKRVAP
jgi:hypothetical protein